MKNILIKLGIVVLCLAMLSVGMTAFAVEMGDNDVSNDWEKEYPIGDVNGDDKVSTADLLALRQYLAGLISEDAIIITSADIDADGSITTADLLPLRQYIAGLIEEL